MPWSNCSKSYEDVPYPEGKRGEEAMVFTDVGIRGWSEKNTGGGADCAGWSANPITNVEWEPVGITWCLSVPVYLSALTTDPVTPTPTALQGQHQRPNRGNGRFRAGHRVH